MLDEKRLEQDSVPGAFCEIGNSEEFSISQKGTNVPGMRTRAKMQVVASDRARRENVPRHILFLCIPSVDRL